MVIKRYCLALVLLVNSVYAFGAEFLYCPITLLYKMDYRSGSGNLLMLLIRVMNLPVVQIQLICWRQKLP